MSRCGAGPSRMEKDDRPLSGSSILPIDKMPLLWCLICCCTSRGTVFSASSCGQYPQAFARHIIFIQEQAGKHYLLSRIKGCPSTPKDISSLCNKPFVDSEEVVAVEPTKFHQFQHMRCCHRGYLYRQSCNGSAWLHRVDIRKRIRQGTTPSQYRQNQFETQSVRRSTSDRPKQRNIVPASQR